MVVVDSSAVIGFLLADGPLRTRLSDERWRAPHVLDLETLSAVGRMVRRGDLHLGVAQEGLRLFGSLRIRRYGHADLRNRIWELRHNLTAYDAAYVALAERLGVPLVTADRGLARAPGLRCLIEAF